MKKEKQTTTKAKGTATDGDKPQPGIVSRIFGAYYGILPLPLNVEDTEILGRLRGKLRIGKGIPERERLRHPVIVGDTVEYRMETKGESGESEAIILSVRDRRGTVLRSSPAEEHALGTNLDRAIVVVSITTPPPRSGFIDRFLASCHYGNVEGIIAFTKLDLLADLDEEEASYAKELIDLYKRVGYRVYCLSLDEKNAGDDLEALSDLLQEGNTLFAGNSGAGKSTLINRLMGREIQKTGDVSASTGKGKHTTTNSSLLVRDESKGLFIDTPGVKEWGVVHMDRAALIASYPELEEASRNCRFRNCDHSEGVLGCAVQDLIDRSLSEEEPEGEERLIDPERFRNLESMIESLDYPDRIRTGDYIKATGRFRNET